MVDAKRLLVFISVYHGGLDFARRFAHRIKEANPKARIIFRCVCAEDHNPDPTVFNGWMHTQEDEDFNDEVQHFLDPTLQPILQGKIIVTSLRLTYLGDEKYKIGATEIEEVEVRSCDIHPDTEIAEKLARWKEDRNTVSIMLVQEDFCIKCLHFRVQ
jgi:hypothetical protein